MSTTDKLAEALRFTKKTVTINAIQWDGTESGIQRIKAVFPALETLAKSGHLRKEAVTRWRIGTLEGGHDVSPGDWIIQGIKGEFYPCKPDIFALTYDAALEAEAKPAPAGFVLVPIDLLVDAADSIADYQASLEFGEVDRETLAQIKVALAAAPAAPAPVPLTQAQRIRLWNNSPQVHGDVVGRDAFERLVKLVESVHRIGEASKKGGAA